MQRSGGVDYQEAPHDMLASQTALGVRPTSIQQLYIYESWYSGIWF